MSTIRMLSGKPCLAERASDWPWASAAARLRHIAGTAWSSKRYLNIELLKDQQMRGAITALSQCRAPLSPNQMMISPPLEFYIPAEHRRTLQRPVPGDSSWRLGGLLHAPASCKSSSGIRHLRRGYARKALLLRLLATKYQNRVRMLGFNCVARLAEWRLAI